MTQIGISSIKLLNSESMTGKDDPERLVNADRAEDEDSFELKLRPRRLKEFIGQQKAKEQLAIALEAAKIPRRGARPCSALRTTWIR